MTFHKGERRGRGADTHPKIIIQTFHRREKR